MSSYIPLHNHSHYSLQLGLSKPSDIAERCLEIQAKSCAITDVGSISGTVSFYKEMISNGIKPILGCELFICENDPTLKNKTNQKLSRLTILCKNLKGWHDLIKIISKCNSQDFFDQKPRIDIKNLQQIINEKNLICITGYHNSTLWNLISSDNQLNVEWQNIANNHISELNNTFGADNVFIELQMFDNFYNQQTIGLELRKFCQDNNYNRLAGIESYYCVEQDSVDQHILLCSNLKTTLPEMSKKILNNIDTGFNHFFNSVSYHILSNEQMKELYDDIELQNTFLIDSKCEAFSPLSKPILPKFEFPKQFKSESEYLRQLCREGWKTKIEPNIPKDQQAVYVERIKQELLVLEGAGLSSYFLIVRDILHFIRSNGWLPGPGRGSAAGCLVSYLIGITCIDPIKYDLLFERFYNAGRNTKDRISMPDIDVDVPIMQRERVIQYIKDRYGEKRVSQMITFNTLKGRGALKEVLRVYNNMSFEEMNTITKHIPDEAKIADELQEIKEEEGSASIIRWTLENSGDKLKDWCYIDENDQLSGPLAKRFEQAIRLEGTKYNQSKHAAGVAIAATDLDNICPMIYDSKTEQNIAGLEMNDLEALGVIKFDILGIALLDKLMSINSYTERVKI
jgi:DNA polymerase-3 subunit alpha